ncbi:hypothetical protein E0E50_16620 [Azotobacter chroococcum subsp. isscasi]|nr:hypothetical protein E0E50_16620 [Azotobacter chroococcum subsp. isscasi]
MLVRIQSLLNATKGIRRSAPNYRWFVEAVLWLLSSVAQWRMFPAVLAHGAVSSSALPVGAGPVLTWGTDLQHFCIESSIVHTNTVRPGT